VNDRGINARRVYHKVTGAIFRGETLSVVMIFLFVTGALLSMFLNPRFYQMGIYEGDVALKDVFAPYDFVYTWGVDEEKTAALRKREIENIPYVFVREPAEEEKAESGIRRFFSFLETEKSSESTVPEKINSVKEFSNDALQEKDIRVLLDFEDTTALLQRAEEVADNVFKLGYASSESMAIVAQENFPRLVIVDDEAGSEIIRTPENIVTPATIETVVGKYLESFFPSDRKIRQPLANVLYAYLVPNIKADAVRTKLRKEEALSSVKPVSREWEVKKNEIIVTKGQRVTGRNVEQLMHISGIFRQGATLKSFFGAAIFFVLIMLLAFVYLSFAGEKYSLKDVKNIAIVLLNMAITLALAEVVMRSPQPSYFLPLAFMGMIITLLVGLNIGFLSLLLMGLFIAMLAGGKAETMFVLLTGGMVGMYTVKDCRRRSDILRAGLFVGIAKFVAIVCVGLINNLDADFFIKDGLWGIASGLLSSFLVMGLLPVFEHFFKVSTNITLLELSDLNHPLLKELSIEAPGTYHHSILVGNLAEAACDAVGANSLLARVGSYYHDIGKIPKAEYFSENEKGGPSRHNNLAPSMSALIISKHVKEGVEMAKKNKLNAKIIDLIEQHHGNSLISFFYQKAIEKSKDKDLLKEENFRYPAPRPQTRESAIILLADSVEASCRAMDDPTPATIKNLVKKIINNKFIDGQLDECDLTLKDIDKIAASFERILLGVYHTRLNYPASTEDKDNVKVKDINGDKYRKPKPQEENKSE
jgi:cyclic-di-AMP phosphodiesterase PgpH